MNRREVLRLSGGAVAALAPFATVSGTAALTGSQRDAEISASSAERWGVFEVALQGPASGNPFVDVRVWAHFMFGHRVVQVDGFYDGDGVYRIRFMPDETGQWSYTTGSNITALNGKAGSFLCTAATGGNHGPVGVRNTFHFGYADGANYYPFGTTCYAWAHQGEALEEQTLKTLASAPFNKVRMCVFPKSYEYNHNEPEFYPFPRSVTGAEAAGANDLARFDVKFFQHFERRIRDLMGLGIEADLILFHPYDRWGYASMPAEVDDRYLRYIIARFSAYRNVWWSLANEYDLMKAKSMPDWDRYARIVQEADPYSHLRSIHYSRTMYDYSHTWVTHASLQNYRFERASEWHREWVKPIIFDEVMYEGDLPSRWGNLPAEEMTRRLWLGIVSGSYVTHGETFMDAQEQLWWSKGGTLRGQSPERIGFLRKLVEQSAGQGLNQADGSYYLSATNWDGKQESLAQGDAKLAYLYYFDFHQPVEYGFQLPSGRRFTAELIDPWAMTMNELPGTYEGKFKLTLPARPYRAVLFRAVR